jgi:uncharacterized protein (DUF305 family)
MVATAPRVAAVVLTFVLALAATACTAQDVPERLVSDAPVVQLGGPGEDNRTLDEDEQLVLPEVAHIPADADFVRSMLPHHAQALVMTGYVPERTQTRDILLLEERMQISQDDEITLMERWLQERGEPVRDPDGGHDEHAAGMPGMLTDAELAQLEAASGDEFDRLFLEFMIRHHEGALAMVAELYAAGGGQEPALGEMARHIESDQAIEIARMSSMLAESGAP